MKLFSAGMLVMVLATGICLAGPKFEIFPADSAAEPGGVVHLRVLVSADQDIFQVRIMPVCPVGFTIKPVTMAGITVRQPAGSILPELVIDSLKAGTSMVVTFLLQAPSRDRGFASMMAPAGRKNFAMKYSYLAGGAGNPVCRSAFFSITYSSSLNRYLLFGLAGGLLGFCAIAASRNAGRSRAGRRTPAPELK